MERLQRAFPEARFLKAFNSVVVVTSKRRAITLTALSGISQPAPILDPAKRRPVNGWATEALGQSVDSGGPAACDL
jgi:hypothetical protein